MSADAPIPLVPRRRVAGHAHGTLRSVRRGPGGDLAGSRAYRPGDDVRKIDRLASARLSLVLGRDEFVVREHFADEATRVVVLEDRSPSMRLFPPELPWLSKPRAVSETVRLLRASAAAARCDFVRRPAGEGLEAELEQLLQGRLGSGSFVFLVSDFLRSPSRQVLIQAIGRGWEVVPVVVQDATWEQSFPDVSGVVLRVFDPELRRARATCLKRRECESRRSENELRFSLLLGQAQDLGLDPIVLSTHEQDEVFDRFRGWAQARGALADRRR